MMDDDARRPRRKWGRWVALGLFLLIVAVIFGHAFWGSYEESELDREVAKLRASGEPMLAGDFKHEAIGDGENAAPILRRAAEAIDIGNEAWERMEEIDLLASASEGNSELVEEVVTRNGAALRILQDARGKKGVDWQIQIRNPMISTLLPDLAQQKQLARLAGEAALLAHREGDDREAVARIRDVLMIGRAMGEMDVGAMPNVIEYFISSMAAGGVIQMLPDLRIGTGRGETSEVEVRMLMGELLDEAGAKERAVRAVKWERAMGVQWISTAEAIWGGTLPRNELEKGGFLLRRFVLKPAIFRDGRFLLRYAQANMKAMAASDNWPQFKKEAQKPRAMLQVVQARPRWHAMAALAAANYEKMVLQRYHAATLRRLAGAGLAMRLYEGEHGGALPGRLEDLAPAYLQAAPGDPMSETRTISYSRERAILWSVGDNGSDEGGSDQVMKKDEGRWGKEDVVVYLKREQRKKSE